MAVAPSLMAQTAGTGGLTGTVTDLTGAVISNVTVTATNPDTGQTRTTTTGADGTYNISLLPPGNYRVKFEAAGFSIVEVPSITITVTETSALDRRLQVSAQAQEITVEGEVETVQTTGATVGTVMTGNSISALPLTTRNYTNLLGLSAGANVAVYDAAALGKGSQDIAVNGGQTTQNNFLMDGVSINIFSSSGSTTDHGGYAGIGIANPDMIQEFKIQTSLFDASFGKKPGANVNVVTKTGTNQFHGTAFEFFRNTDLNANDFFRNQSPPISGVPDNSRQVLNQNEFGGVLGGPVKKDKLFFFAGYQETRQKNGVAIQGFAVATLPPIPAGDRSNTAAFQAALGAAFCPSNTTTGGSTSNGGVQVLCSGANINPVSMALLGLKNPDGSYYIPSSSNGGYQTTTFSIPATYAEHQAMGNVDYVINSKNTFSTRYFYSEDPTIGPFGCAISQGLGTPPSNCLPDTGGNTAYASQDAIMRLTSILNNNTVNEARLSFQYASAHLANGVPFTNNQVGIASLLPNINTLDEFSVSGQWSIGTYFGLGSDKRTMSWQAADQMSWNHGKHTVRFGFEYERGRINQTLPGDSIGGTLTFQTMQDFLLGLPGCSPQQTAAGCSPAHPFPGTNGTPTSNISSSGSYDALADPNGVFVEFRAPDADAFVQDDIKLTARLTLNVGVRWEMTGLMDSKLGELTNVWPSEINTVPIPGNSPTCNAQSPVGCTPGTLAGFVVPSNFNFASNPAPPVGGLFQSNHNIGTENGNFYDKFAPRIGFAWQPTGSNRFAVRGGFGYFYDHLTIGNYSTVYYIGVPVSILEAESGQANYYSSFAQPYPAGLQLGWTPRWVNFASGTSSNLSQYIQGQNYLVPLVDEWNFNIQYEFLPSWVLEVGYVGSHGIHQAVGNQLINQAQLVGNPLNNNDGWTPAPAIAAGLVTTNTISNASLRVPYLGFAPGGLIDQTTNGDDKFNSLQVTVRKTVSHGLMVQAAYTWSKSLYTGSSLNYNDANNYGAQYGPNSSYHPQRLAVSYSWNLPLGGPEGLRGKLVNGWTLSGVTIAQDGTPLTVTDSRGGSIYGFGPGASELSTGEFCSGMGAANMASSGSDKQRLGGANGGQGWFNKAAFCAVPVSPYASDGKATGYGDSPIGAILGPGQFNWDATLSKLTKVGGLREDATLEFRTEFFNAFNHAQFNNPAVVDDSKATFGQITSTAVNPRLIQFALKYAF
jgi:hypothetical protein